MRVYFLGIGGIGMSALARYYIGRGHEVAGYDRTRTVLTESLEREGMAIHYTEDVTKVMPNPDLVIYTTAILKTHAEWIFLQEKGVPFKKRAEVLGMLSNEHKCIAVAGTHGKTTTSSIVTHLLRTGGIDCTAFLGGISNNLKSNFVEGTSDWVVVEADEFDRSFMQLYPTITVVNSTDPDHLDIYGTAAALEEAYADFVNQTQAGGTVFYRNGISLALKEGDKVAFKQHSFDVVTSNTHNATNSAADDTKAGVFEPENQTIACKYYACNIHVSEGFFVFDYVSPHGTMKELIFTLPGAHNVANATAAIAVAETLGVTEEKIREGLRSFAGIHRRFDWVVRNDTTVYIDDYAHHPTELRAAIDAARQLFPERRITGIFQPHLYSRTRDFVHGFAEALDRLDEVILLPIYPARELPMEGVESEIIRNLMHNPRVRIMPKDKIVEYLRQHRPEVLLTLGAGDIDTLVKPIKELLQ